MAETERLPELGGQFSEDCPKCHRRECYVACRHVNDILQRFYNFENYVSSKRHKVLAESILNLQDGLLSQICTFTVDECVQGSWLGFPCVQCKDVCTSGTTPFLCGYDSITFDNCVTTEVDFKSTPALQAIYQSVLSAITKSYDATVKGVQDYADEVFSVTSEVINFQQHVMHLDLTRSLTPDEETAWIFIKDTFPAPIGVEVDLVTN